MSTLKTILHFLLLSVSAIAASDVSAASIQGKYAETFSYCRDISGYLVTPGKPGEQEPQQQSALHDFSAIPEGLLKTLRVEGNIFLPTTIEKLGLNIKELEPPSHGKVISTDPPDKQYETHMPDGKTIPLPIGTTSYSYTYMPELGYLGEDRVTYEVQAYKKRYKVIVNFLVLPIADDENPQCVNHRFPP